MRQVTRKGLMTVAAATGVIAATGGYASADSGAQSTAAHSPGVLSGNSVQAPVHAPVDVCGNTVSVVGAFNPSAGNKCADGGGGAHGGAAQGHGAGGSRADGHTGGSSGIASGNDVQAPVDAPVDVCGNSVNVAAVGDPAIGNECGAGHGGGHGTSPGGAHHNPPGDSGHRSDDSGHPAGPGGTADPGGAGGSGGVTDRARPAGPVEPGRPGDGGRAGGPGDGGHRSGPGAHGEPVVQGALLSGDALAAQTVGRPAGVAQLARTGADLPLGLALPVGAGALLGGALLYRKARAAG